MHDHVIQCLTKVATMEKFHAGSVIAFWEVMHIDHFLQLKS